MLCGINLIRGVSALLIVTFHTTEFVKSNWGGFASDYVLHAPGLHLFMIVSGFFVAFRVRHDDSPLAYVARRLARITPLYWSLTTIAILLASVRHWTLPNADLSIQSIVSSYLYIPHFNLYDRARPILFVAWNLNLLVMLYVLFGLSFLVKPRFRILLVTTVIVCLVFAGERFLTGAAAAAYTNPILLEFAGGIALASLMKLNPVIRWIKATALWPLAVFGLAGMYATKLAMLPALWESIAFLVTGLCVVFAIAGMDLYKKSFDHPLANELGDLSFAIYLVHPLVIAALGVAIQDRIGVIWIEIALLTAAVLAATLLIAWPSRKFIEVPAQKWLRKRIDELSAVGLRPQPKV